MKLFWEIVTLIFCVTIGLIYFSVGENLVTTAISPQIIEYILFPSALINFFLHFLFIYFITLFLYQKISKKNIDYKQLIKLSASISYFKLVLFTTILLILKTITHFLQLSPTLNLEQQIYQSIYLVIQGYLSFGPLALYLLGGILTEITYLIISVSSTLIIFITILSIFVYLLLKKNTFNKKEALIFIAIICLIEVILPIGYNNGFLFIPIIFEIICYKLISNDKTITNPIKHYALTIGIILLYWLPQLFLLLATLSHLISY